MPSHSSDVCDINAEKIVLFGSFQSVLMLFFLTLEAETEKKKTVSILLVADLKLLIKSLDARVAQLILFAWSLPQFSSLSFLSSFIP